MRPGTTHKGSGLPPGVWTIWSSGPGASTAWMLPSDNTAKAHGFKFILARWHKKTSEWKIIETTKG